METQEAVRGHYDTMDGEGNLVAQITRMVDALGSEPRSAAELAGLDQFHLRGLAATQELAELAGLNPSMGVLDAGSGIGGPSRYLAEAYGCTVIGVDLTPSFVTVATILAERTALADRVSFRVGDLHALPFDDATFDVVWTQHVVMNVPDRDRVYREFRRVLKPGGIVAFYDVIAADNALEPHLPVPWSASSETNFLLNETQTRAAFERNALALTTWRDLTPEALAWLEQPRQPASQALSLATIMGPRLAEMTMNFARNLREGRIRIAMGIARAR